MNNKTHLFLNQRNHRLCFADLPLLLMPSSGTTMMLSITYTGRVSACGPLRVSSSIRFRLYTPGGPTRSAVWQTTCFDLTSPGLVVTMAFFISGVLYVVTIVSLFPEVSRSRVKLTFVFSCLPTITAMTCLAT